MKIEIMSGQPNVEINERFTELLKQNSYDAGDLEQRNFMIYPENDLRQPKKIYESIREKVKKHMEDGNDLFILTYSDHVLNAVRVEIKNHQFPGGKVHQIIATGEDIIADIGIDGRLDIWIEDIFDVWDQALYSLVD